MAIRKVRSKKKSKKKNLSAQELTELVKKYNLITTENMTDEENIKSLKEWGAFNRISDETPEEHRQRIEMVTGLINFDRLWDKEKKRPVVDVDWSRL